jgi:hypothetical protein
MTWSKRMEDAHGHRGAGAAEAPALFPGVGGNAGIVSRPPGDAWRGRQARSGAAEPAGHHQHQSRREHAYRRGEGRVHANESFQSAHKSPPRAATSTAARPYVFRGSGGFASEIIPSNPRTCPPPGRPPAEAAICQQPQAAAAEQREGRRLRGAHQLGRGRDSGGGAVALTRRVVGRVRGEGRSQLRPGHHRAAPANRAIVGS